MHCIDLVAGSTCVRVTSYQTLIPFLGIYVSLAVRNPRAQQTGEPAVVPQVLTKDHKPDDPEETRLIESLGGFLTFTCMLTTSHANSAFMYAL